MLKMRRSVNQTISSLSAPPKSNMSSRVTLIFVPNESATPLKISLSQRAFWIIATLVISVLAGASALSIRYFQIRTLNRELADIKREHESILNEATALYSQLLDVQSNLNQVDSFSNQVREATKIEDATGNPVRDPKMLLRADSQKKRPAGPLGLVDRLRAIESNSGKKLDLSIPASEGIGPISKDDFAKQLENGPKPQNLAVAAKVKPSSLEFGSIFSELDAVKEQSSNQIDDLSTLLTEVHQYRTRIDQTPTLSPVNGRLTSTFGVRESPMSGKFAMHKGLDIAAPLGSPIRAAAAGTVLKVGRASDYGKFVLLKHGHNVTTVYAHAQQILVRQGDVVHKGQRIALVGMTGRTTGPHLHYEIRIGSQRVNPAKYLSFNRP
jgi:murein DD-endopeptidase MepM/ murein hydrolase activator NlpD